MTTTEPQANPHSAHGHAESADRDTGSHRPWTVLILALAAEQCLKPVDRVPGLDARVGVPSR